MSQLVEGQILDGRYRIGATIAHGGMSTVYCATDLRLDRRVAAKVMDPRFVNDESFRIRFEREARAVAHLNDESLVNVYDQGTDPAGHVFLIMEFIDGGTLRELLRERGPMPPHAAAVVMRSVLRALSVAHSRGMVHRDIKPENVLISFYGRVKLADFGLVRAAADAKVTSNSVIVGTVAYLAPEQVTGESISPASDVYSAGILLFELLTGTTPFIADTSLGVAMKRLNEDVPPPSELIDGVPEEFDELVARACARRPEDRFESAEEFADALEDIVYELDLPPFRVPSPVNSAAANAAAIEDPIPDIRRPVPRDNDQVDDHHDTAETTPERFGHDDYAGYGLSTDTPGYPEAPPPPGPPNIFADFDDPDAGRTRTFDRHDGYNPTGWESPEPSGGALVPADVPGAPEYPLPPDTQGAQHPQHPQPRSAQTQTPKSRRATRQRTRRGCALWLIIALVATLGMGLGAWWLGSGRYGEVPSITGLSQPQAMTAISEAGFEPVVDERYDNDVAVSQIIGSDPLAGARVVRGDDVRVLVSLGRPTVPAYPANHSKEVFSAALAKRTLKEEVGDPVFSDDVSTGGLVFAVPAPGQTVEVGSVVTVHYSKGPAPVKVPKIVGLQEDEARELLSKAGLEVREVSAEFSSSAEPDEVLSVSPEEGTGLERGSSVTLTINNGIEVPNVVGKSEDTARQILQREGIEVSEVKDASSSSRDYGRVDAVSPSAGRLVNPNDATVTLTVSRAVKVPQLLGKTVAQARREAEKQHLQLDIDGSANDDDRIVLQSPRPGAKATAGDSISVSTL
ncbi:PASTA domain-containing protein [Corynebacterium amycolatum]|uniref:non-specific serine/threonine protein kinase n=2 Tax=Corynebacterium TaxID=1716 RepID=A0AAW9SWX6_CORAY|nr:Stk1 family PASTA domain-containing Ser/Thr kinase [Corynebacterium amycolatum]MDK7236659.1 PASTA domain-containing protein [Corynebacterium amycolatum]MDK7246632.1 PASTA domain-containing protein [Corynebacterium amycolatum]